MTPSLRRPSIPAPAGTARTSVPARGALLSAATALRTRTAAFHLDTEAAYSGFDLRDRHSYTRFLQAQVRAVAAAERALAGTPGLPAWRPRTPFLRGDLEALGALVPDALPFPAALDLGRAWGALYVLEGSRIGSEMLGRGVGENLPCAYLGQSHGPGEWRGFRAELGTALGSDELMLERAVVGAIACFTLFATAARSSTSWDPWGTGFGVKDRLGTDAEDGVRRPGAADELVALQGYPSGFESPARRDVG